MRSIRIHLDEKRRAFGETDPERVFIGRADAELALPV